MGLKYGDNVDVFGSGVVLYVLLFGRMPFQGRDVCSTARRTIRCEVKLDSNGGSEYKLQAVFAPSLVQEPL